MRRAFVADVRRSELVIRKAGSEEFDWLSGFQVRQRGSQQLVVTFDETSTARLLELLRDHGVAFAGGSSGRPPAEAFADLRERGLVQGTFDEIVFGSAGAIVRSR